LRALRLKILLKRTLFFRRINYNLPYNGNVLDFTNAVRTPIHRLIKAKETPSIQHFLWVFQGCMEAPNEEFRNFIFTLYAEYRNNGPAKSLSMLQLLDKLDT
jgi:hypothetical protein